MNNLKMETKGLNLHQLAKACGSDERFAFDTVQLSPIDTGVRLTVTDGRVMVQRDLAADGQLDGPVLIHPSAFKGNPDSVEINGAVISHKGTSQTTSPIQEGRYPPIDKVRKGAMKKKYKVAVQIDPWILIDALTALGIRRPRAGNRSEDLVSLFVNSDKDALTLQSADGVAFVMPIRQDNDKPLGTKPGGN